MFLRIVGGVAVCALSIVFLGLITASMAKQSKKSAS